MDNTTPGNAPQNTAPAAVNVQNQSSVPGSAGVTENKSSIGGIVSTIIIIALIILGGLYFWGKQIEESRMQEDALGTQTADEVNTQANADASDPNTVSSSDEVDALDADLGATNTNDLDIELQ